MFKAFFNIVLALNLLISLTGFSLSKHYCGNELVRIAVDLEAKSCCTSDCNRCHNESHYVKLDENSVTPVISQKIHPYVIELLPLILVITDVPAIDQNSKFFIDATGSPPGKVKQLSSSFLQAFLL